MNVIVIGIMLCAPLLFLIFAMYYVVLRPVIRDINREPLIEDL